MVNSINIGWGCENNLICSSIEMALDLFLREENSGGFANVVSMEATPLDISWISLTKDLDKFSVDYEASVSDLDSARESSVDSRRYFR
jgi:hypothetical protein